MMAVVVMKLLGKRTPCARMSLSTHIPYLSVRLCICLIQEQEHVFYVCDRI